MVSFTSDWLYPTRESREVVQALNAVAANVSFVEIESDKGHDAFLLDEPELFATVRGFVNAAARRRGLPRPEGVRMKATKTESSVVSGQWWGRNPARGLNSPLTTDH